MSTVLWQTLLFAATGLFSLGSITLVILMLMAESGWRSGLGYAAGYTLAYALLGTGVVSLGYHAELETGGGKGVFFPLLLLVFGVLLLWLAFRSRRAADRTPRFFSVVDGITPWKAFGFGVLVTVANIKNLALFLSALSIVVLSDLLFFQKIAAALLDALVFSFSVMLPVIVYLLFPERARGLLESVRVQIQRHSRAVGFWLPLIFGTMLVVKGLLDLP